MARIRMIAVDLDGTLLNSRKRISAEDAEALREATARGVEIVVVTGRNFTTALPLVEDLLASGPLIASNGAIIRSKTGETFQRGLLPAAVAGEVLRATRDVRAYTVLTYDLPGQGQFRIETPNQSRPAVRDKRAVNVVAPHDGALRQDQDGEQSPSISLGVAASPWVQRYSAAVRFTESLERELDGDPIEIMFAGPLALMREVAERLAKLATEAQRPRDTLVRTRHCEEAEETKNATESREAMRFRLLRTEYPERDFAIMDVIHPDCSKGRAVEAWSRFRGIPRDEIMAIGDNYNDLDMLRFAGVPVVMGNSEEALKQEGWPVTLDCDSGGVARAVERYVLEAEEAEET